MSPREAEGTSGASFASLNLHPSLLRAVKDLGYVRPTPIQTAAIPAGLEGRDILASAQTGSGKTAAFMLPIVHHLIDKPRGTTRALVLAPTRELAAQILADLQDLAVHTPVTGAAVFGGVGHGPQEHAFRSGVNVIVATPGRLLDHLRAPYARLDKLEYLVLDEADRMLDMGFLPEIRKILRYVPAKRQTLFFSATMPPPIRKLTVELLKQPAMIQIAKPETTPTGITQAVYPVSQELKAPLLLMLLKRGEIRQALVFTRTKHRANRLADTLVQAGINAGRLHGNRTQAQRTAALDAFRSGRCPVLVATDIAARGIDVEDLGHVVNFDVPLVPEDYVHRIGRTGRAEAQGEAWTLVAPEERGEMAAIERTVGRLLPRVTVPDFDYAARPSATLEVPRAQRIAEIRKRKAEDRARGEARRKRREGGPQAHAPGGPDRSGGQGPRKPSHGPAGARPGPSGNRWSFGPRRRPR